MGCGSSKSSTADPSNAPAAATAPANTPATAANGSSKAPPKENKKDKKDTKKAEPPKKAEAFEVDLGDGKKPAGSVRAPPRLTEKKNDKKQITAEEIEAKLRAAEERRQEQQVDAISKLKEHTEHVEDVKSSVAEGNEVKRKVRPKHKCII